MFFSVFYCLCHHKERYIDMSEDQVEEERDPDLNKEDGIRFDGIMKENWRDVAEEDGDKRKIHALRWEVYVKEKEELIKREFFVSVPHPKGGAIILTCVKDHIINEKDDYKDIGLCGFYDKLFEEEEARETR